MYALVQNNTVTQFVTILPTAWKNISGLHLASPAELKTLGWLPVVITETIPANDETRDNDEVTIEAERVLVVQRVRAKNKEEIDRDWVTLRIERDQRLHDTDWTHASDHPSPVAAAKKTEWKTYRQALRDLPETADPTIWPPSWPTEPE